MKRTLVVLLALTASLSVSMAQTVVNTGFTSGETESYSDGDLNGQQGWATVPTTGGNVFDVTDSAGSGFIDTAPATANVQSNGNYVYKDTSALGNAVDDEWDGVMDFTLSTTTNAWQTFDYLRMGLSSTVTNPLTLTAANEVDLRVRAFGTGILELSLVGADFQDRPILLTIPAAELGWDAPASDLETDQLRLSWKIRKTRESNVFGVSCSLLNLTTTSNYTSSIGYITKSDAYAATGHYFTMGRQSSAWGATDSEYSNIKIDDLSLIKSAGNAPTLVPPSVQAGSADSTVNLNWNNVLEATEYDITVSTAGIGGPYSPLASGLTTNAYTHTGLVNGSEYYYIITAKADAGAVTAASDPALGEPAPVLFNLSLFDTTFASTSSPAYADGDLAGQNNWKQMPSTPANTFNVISSGDGFAETAANSNSFVEGTSRQVYYNANMSNDVGNAWTGSMKFRLETTPNGTIVTNGANIQEVASLGLGRKLQFGLTSDKNNALANDGIDDITFDVVLRANGNMHLNLNGTNNRLVNSYDEITATQLGWDPTWNDANPSNAPDFVTDWITLNYYIRKTEIPGLYSAELGATIGAQTYGGGLLFTDVAAPSNAYSATSVVFAMGQSGEAISRNAGSGDSLVNINVDSISLSHTNASDITPWPPQNVSSTIGNLEIGLLWEGNQQILSYDVLRSDTPTGPQTLLTNTTDTAYTDTGLVDLRTYFYTIAANYPGAVTTNSAQLAVRALGKQTPMVWGFRDDFTAGGQVNSDVDLFENATNGIVNKSESWASIPGTAPVVVQQYASGSIQLNNTPTLRDSSPYDEMRIRVDSPDLGNGAGGDNDPSTYMVYIEPGTAVDATAATYAYESLCSNFDGNRRALIRNGSTWYVSETILGAQGNILVIEDLTTEKWAVFEMPTAFTTNYVSTNGLSFVTVAGLTDVNAIGIMSYQSNDRSNNYINGFRLSTGSLPSTYMLWTDSQGIYNEDAAATNDFDGDGFVNLWEWAFNGNPTGPNANGISGNNITTSVDGSGNLVVVYARLTDTARPTYFLTESDDLVFTPFTNEEGSYTIIEGGAQSWNFNFDAITNIIPTTDAVKFIKLNVTE